MPVFALSAINFSSRKQGVWLWSQVAPSRTVCTKSFKNHEITLKISMTAFIILYGHAGMLRCNDITMLLIASTGLHTTMRTDISRMIAHVFDSVFATANLRFSGYRLYSQ